jgi:hypothetical protein
MALPNAVQHFQPFPLKVFFNNRDVTDINAWTLHKDVTGNKNSRQNFIVRLAYEHRQNYVMPNRSATVPNYSRVRSENKFYEDRDLSDCEMASLWINTDVSEENAASLFRGDRSALR